MIIFGMAIRDKHGRVGQGKPGFPHFADEAVLSLPRTSSRIQLHISALLEFGDETQEVATEAVFNDSIETASG